MDELIFTAVRLPKKLIKSAKIECLKKEMSFQAWLAEVIRKALKEKKEKKEKI